MKQLKNLRDNKLVRDMIRYSGVSYFAAVEPKIELQEARHGHDEAIRNKHYPDLLPPEDAQDFFSWRPTTSKIPAGRGG